MRKQVVLLTFLLTGFLTTSGYAQNNPDDVTMKSENLGDSVYMLTGMGGNIGVSAGEDGLLIIDDQYEPMAEKISAALDSILKDKLRYVINTHYHGDHTGSNAYMKEVKDATIFAHDNVRVRLLNKEEHKHSELPVVTYSQGVTFHFNGDTLKVMHLSNAHTDGDSVVMFEKANVLHTGDLFFNGLFPYIDIDSGGSVKGYIAGVEKLISMIDDDTKIIPGHGPLGDKAQLQAFVEMIKQTSSQVKQLKINGLPVEDIIDAGLDDKWKEWSWAFINEEKWIRTLYR
ncbi:MBL fold metallo-hydrolase [Aliiglaciecola sp. 2_MG-2023]|uniref:MBL fold metallo-hydrolase n=1 Tax=unclassified Aliiglaciecola TaxID=2593648 RepID=UPI0026E3F6FB|nr:MULTISPECIES: MBL fold metallo-hydrolase [unclassified Aliiglaciecola]MDO6709511.1 MBL fold metallo-hydrolase [Aliiglaciecola sp. 2_MG-2023]MDO6750947.1 MBL fold metallo-hydrolase [Aliiglaciecola sp. 1_MG-2023]